MKPILFNTEMVKAILEGRKTQTRRLMKPQPLFYTGRKYIFEDAECPKKWEGCQNIIATYKYQPGDILYVREAWCDPEPENPYVPFLYKADMPQLIHAEDTAHGEPVHIEAEDFKWRPSIHMPKELARIFLRVTDVRIERLKDIFERYEPGLYNPVVKEGFKYLADFIAVWEKTINKNERDKYGWGANPWVWVISFERCEKPEMER